jgi:splicing factor 3B subunit 2
MLSQDLIAALGMQEGSPPPWLINMQRYGPPPSYPNLRIPGLNAPLPPGAAYGYQPGGWGKPPVDEYGRPLYGDVFGVSSTNEVDTGPIVDKEFRWGGFEIEEINEFEEEEDDNEDEDEEEDQEGNRSASTRTVIDQSGLDTPSTLDGTASMISGMETPAVIDLRKRAGTETPDTHSSQRELFQVIQEKKGSALAGGQLFGSDRTYVMNNNKADVHMSLNPDDIDEVIKDKDKLKDAHESYQQDGMFKHMNNFSTDGIESEEDKSRGSKKRKAEQQPVISRKMKEFKF